MFIVFILILAIVQGLAELLPVSSSAHVVVAEKLMGLDPSSPQMTLVLVMLHTGTMLAVIVYFWRRWRSSYFENATAFKKSALQIIVATVLTGIVGEVIIKIIEKTAFKNAPHAEIEQLFSHLELVAPALACAGLLILFAGLRERRPIVVPSGAEGLSLRQASWIGLIQGLCLPFRGFSRSGATISTGMLLGAERERCETFSFALAVVLTPAVIGREVLRLVKAEHISSGTALGSAAFPALLGAVFSFFAGLVALRWLSSWLEAGRWYLFGIYCLVAAIAVEMLHLAGY